MMRFRCYRPHPPESYYVQGAANPPDEVQFEGVVFSDGTVCVRWLTTYSSHSVWAGIGDLIAIHGHPEYGTWFEWLDGRPDDLIPVIGSDDGEAWNRFHRLAQDPS